MKASHWLPRLTTSRRTLFLRYINSHYFEDQKHFKNSEFKCWILAMNLQSLQLASHMIGTTTHKN
jgi:hypothetical protein